LQNIITLIYAIFYRILILLGCGRDSNWTVEGSAEQKNGGF